MKGMEILKLNEYWRLRDVLQMVDMNQGYSGIREGTLQF